MPRISINTSTDIQNCTITVFKAMIEDIKQSFSHETQRWLAPRTLLTLLGLPRNWPTRLAQKDIVDGPQKVLAVYRELALTE